MKNSGASQVYLKSLDLSSSGRYRCEVSGEAPSFTTVTEHNDMVTVGEYILYLLYVLVSILYVSAGRYGTIQTRDNQSFARSLTNDRIDER